MRDQTMLHQPRSIASLTMTQHGSGYIGISAHGAAIELSADAYKLICAVEAQRNRGADDERAFAAVAAELSRGGAPLVTSTQVGEAYSSVLEQIQVEEARPRKPAGLWIQRPVLSAPLVYKLSRQLTWLFRPWVAIVLTATIALGVGLGLQQGLTLALRRELVHAFAPGDVILGYLLLLFSLLLHELGHSAACVFFGVRPRAIGVGIYFIFPVLYADVTGAWVLARPQRIVVTLGGSYVQLLVAAGFVACFLASGWPPFAVGFLLILSSTLYGLYPYLKLDGYWLLSDLLDVRDLSEQPARLAHYLWSRLCGRPGPVLPWSPPILVALTVYTLAPVAVGAYLLWVARGALMIAVADLYRFISTLVL